MFSCEICAIFKNKYCEEHLRMNTSVVQYFTFQMYDEYLIITIWMYKRFLVSPCSFLNIYKHTDFQHTDFHRFSKYTFMYWKICGDLVHFAENYTTTYLQKQPFADILLKHVLKNFEIFTWKHLCWSLFSIKLQACFPVNIARFLRTALL